MREPQRYRGIRYDDCRSFCGRVAYYDRVKIAKFEALWADEATNKENRRAIVGRSSISTETATRSTVSAYTGKLKAVHGKVQEDPSRSLRRQEYRAIYKKQERSGEFLK